MKKLLIIFIMAPLAAFGQLRVPHFPIDSNTNLITFTLKVSLPGVAKEKIFGVMSKWFTNIQGANSQPLVLLPARPGVMLVRADMSENYSEQISKNGYYSSGNIDTFYQLQMAVTDENLIITLTNFRLERRVMGPSLEDFCAHRVHVINGQNIDGSTYVWNFYSNMLDDIDMKANDMIADAQKEVKKAQKKKLL